MRIDKLVRHRSISAASRWLVRALAMVAGFMAFVAPGLAVRRPVHGGRSVRHRKCRESCRCIFRPSRGILGRRRAAAGDALEFRRLAGGPDPRRVRRHVRGRHERHSSVRLGEDRDAGILPDLNSGRVERERRFGDVLEQAGLPFGQCCRRRRRAVCWVGKRQSRPLACAAVEQPRRQPH